jgi:FtsX-like permease family protein
VSDSGLSMLLLLTIFIAVSAPVLVLAATAGRLAAAMRDRRLANLRLLGLSPGLTRLVAAVETGVAAVTGTLMGWVSFLLLRPVLALWHPPGRDWSVSTLHPRWHDYVVILLLIPLAVVLVSAIPQRTRSADALALARRSTRFRPQQRPVHPLHVRRNHASRDRRDPGGTDPRPPPGRRAGTADRSPWPGDRRPPAAGADGGDDPGGRRAVGGALRRDRCVPSSWRSSRRLSTSRRCG